MVGLLTTTLLLVFFILPICSSQDEQCKANIWGSKIILFPLHSGTSINLNCEMCAGGEANWEMNGHYIPNSACNITADFNTSQLSLTDWCLEKFHQGNESSKTLHVTCLDIFNENGRDSARIITFGPPSSPYNGTIRKNTIVWNRPKNMPPEVPVWYKIVVKDTHTDSPMVMRTNETEVTMDMIPKCYKIEVKAENDAGPSRSSILLFKCDLHDTPSPVLPTSSPTPSPSSDLVNKPTALIPVLLLLLSKTVL